MIKAAESGIKNVFFSPQAPGKWKEYSCKAIQAVKGIPHSPWRKPHPLRSTLFYFPFFNLWNYIMSFYFSFESFYSINILLHF